MSPRLPAAGRATLGIAATAFVFELCGRNPKRIKRWPFHVLPTRRTTLHKQTRPNIGRLKIKLRTHSVDLGRRAHGKDRGGEAVHMVAAGHRSDLTGGEEAGHRLEP